MEIGVIKAIQSLNDARISDVITALAGVHDLSGTFSKDKTAVEPAAAAAPAAPAEEIPAPPSTATTEVAAEAISPPQNPLAKSGNKTDDIAGGLDRFIHEAEEGSTEVVAPKPATPAPAAVKPEAKPEAPVKAEEPDSSIDDEFQNDPLIQQAMDTFQASRIS